MKRTAYRRRHRRRKAVEQANRHSLTVPVTEPLPAPTELAEDSIVGIMRSRKSERIDLPFEIAQENEAAVVSEEANGKAASEPTAPQDELSEGKQAVDSNTATTEPEEPSAEELLYNAAREAQAQGEHRRALAIYRELLSVVPEHLKARNNLALLLDQNGDHEEALHELKLCLRTEPNNPQVLVNRGGVLGSLGRYKEAEADLRRALDFDGTNAEAYFNLGLLMSRKGLWREALPHLRRSVELDASRAVAYTYLGDALNHVDDLDGALQAFQRSVELVPNNDKALYGLGIIYDR
ncbi:MAG: tetratricopeptide repeat protein, partial [Gemmatimonadetes bacterium]|nr:tetratricopeptide repeat protein [Gemmatimonadota bacterium]